MDLKPSALEGCLLRSTAAFRLTGCPLHAAVSSSQEQRLLHRENEDCIVVSPTRDLHLGFVGSFRSLPAGLKSSLVHVLCLMCLLFFLFSGSISIVFHHIRHTAKPHSLPSPKIAVVIWQSSRQRNLDRTEVCSFSIWPIQVLCVVYLSSARWR